MQRSDIETTPLLQAVRGKDVTIKIIPPYAIRLENCIRALQRGKSLETTEDNRSGYTCVITSGLIAAAIALMESLVWMMMAPSNDYFNDLKGYNNYIPYQSSSTCGILYPLKSIDAEWPYFSCDFDPCYACRDEYEYRSTDDEMLRAFILLTTSLITVVISCCFAFLLGCFLLKDEHVKLNDLSTELSDEISTLLTMANIPIQSDSEIDSTINKLQAVLDDVNQRESKKLVFLNGANDRKSPLFKFFHGQTTNNIYRAGDGDKLATNLIFQYAGLSGPEDKRQDGAANKPM